MSIGNWLQQLRRVEPGASGRPPYVWLLYLGLLFMPGLWSPADLRWLWPTLATLPVFFFFYVRCLRPGGRARLADVVAVAALSYVLEPYNGFANTYLVYAAAFAPHVLPGIARPLALVGVTVAVHAAQVLLLGQPPAVIGITTLVCLVSCLGNVYAVANRRRNEALRLTQEEVRHLAAVAERERIGRDLHDLLGHTLSLIAIKGELAGKLVGRDPAGAEREIREVTQIARDALGQVRTAVTGMRSAALAGELASAHMLLESCGIALECRHESAPLPPAVETALAMIVREAATNIQRHAHATRATVEISTAPGAGAAAATVALCVSDNGRGGVTTRGNGLAGIGERVRALGGTLEIDSPPGAGTVLRASLPVAP